MTTKTGVGSRDGQPPPTGDNDEEQAGALLASKQTSSPYYNTGWMDVVKAYLYFWPKTSAAVGGLAVVFVLIATFGGGGRASVSEKAAKIGRDYSHITGLNDLNIGKITHWCLIGDDDHCRCEDPTEGVKGLVKEWLPTHEMNIELITDTVSSGGLSTVQDGELDVVFLGDSTIEGWNGRWMGQESKMAEGVPDLFDAMFHKEGGGKVEGLALGIASDASTNLLWRIQNGEMPDALKPKVWWLLIGLNDFLRDSCSPEVVLMGVLRVIEEIKIRRPDATIVVNGILPTTRRPDGKLVHDQPKFPHPGMPERTYLDLWPSIESVNRQLEDFCQNNHNMHYFDPNHIFLGSVGNEHFTREEKVIVSELMTDHMHPSLLGYKIWGEHIVKKLTKILNIGDE